MHSLLENHADDTDGNSDSGVAMATVDHLLSGTVILLGQSGRDTLN